MNYECPNDMKMSKKEEKEISEKLNSTARGMSKSFLKGLFFFITVPISIYNKIKKAWKWNPTGEL